METGSVKKRWVDDNHLAFEDVMLELYFAADAEPSESTFPLFRLEKSRPMVEFYEERFASAPIINMVEIGVRYGGSVVLFLKLLRPAKLVAIEISPDRVPELDAYLDRSGAAPAVDVLFGVDQADALTLRRIVAEQFGEAPIDLVIDDGCHWLDETRRCFNALFPYVRSGGTYVIEDWSWAHWGGDEWQQGGGMWRERPSLTPLVLELAMLSASRPDIVESVHVCRDLVVVNKGNASVAVEFDLSASYVTGGRRFVELLPGDSSSPPDLAYLRRVRGLLRREGAAALVHRLAHKLGRALGRRRRPTP